MEQALLFFGLGTAIFNVDSTTKGTANGKRDVSREFPHKVCINIDQRRERWEHARKEFAWHNINSVRGETGES